MATVKSASPSLRRRANAQNVSFRISLRWPIHIINSVDKTKLSLKGTPILPFSIFQSALLQKELLGTKTKLSEQTERIDSLIESLDNLEQYSRKNSLEIHGIPENIYTSTEEVVLKVAAAVNVPVAAEDIEISHKLRRRNGMKPIIVKF